MNESNEHLNKLYNLRDEFENKSGDEVIGEMIPEFASLIVSLSSELDKAQRKVVKLTWALFWLTITLTVIGAAQLSFSFIVLPQAGAVLNEANKIDAQYQRPDKTKKLVQTTNISPSVNIEKKGITKTKD
jgi:hypothetical protein